MLCSVARGANLPLQNTPWFAMTASVAGYGFFIRTNSPPVRNDRRAAPSFGERITKRSRFVKPPGRRHSYFTNPGGFGKWETPPPDGGGVLFNADFRQSKGTNFRLMPFACPSLFWREGGRCINQLIPLIVTFDAELFLILYVPLNLVSTVLVPVKLTVYVPEIKWASISTAAQCSPLKV